VVEDRGPVLSPLLVVTIDEPRSYRWLTILKSKSAPASSSGRYRGKLGEPEDLFGIQQGSLAYECGARPVGFLKVGQIRTICCA
jgi:hypothetical protein